MKFTLLSLLLLAATTTKAHQIEGTWKYTSFAYETMRIPIPHEKLNLKIKFGKDGRSTLRWSHPNESGFCERIAQYLIYDDNQVWQQTVWVNPKNHISCSADPDMQIDGESKTKFSILNRRLYFHMVLDGKPFKYILRRIK